MLDVVDKALLIEFIEHDGSFMLISLLGLAYKYLVRLSLHLFPKCASVAKPNLNMLDIEKKHLDGLESKLVCCIEGTGEFISLLR